MTKIVAGISAASSTGSRLLWLSCQPSSNESATRPGGGGAPWAGPLSASSATVTKRKPLARSSATWARSRPGSTQKKFGSSTTRVCGDAVVAEDQRPPAGGLAQPREDGAREPHDFLRTSVGHAAPRAARRDHEAAADRRQRHEAPVDARLAGGEAVLVLLVAGAEVEHVLVARERVGDDPVEQRQRRALARPLGIEAAEPPAAAAAGREEQLRADDLPLGLERPQAEAPGRQQLAPGLGQHRLDARREDAGAAAEVPARAVQARERGEVARELGRSAVVSRQPAPRASSRRQSWRIRRRKLPLRLASHASWPPASSISGEGTVTSR